MQHTAKCIIITTYACVLIWCLLKRYGVEPPGLIKLEKEIEQEETLSAPSPSPSPSSKSSGKKSTGNLLDDAVSTIGQVSYQHLVFFELQNLFWTIFDQSNLYLFQCYWNLF